ncbi:MerR family transcriptional regulator [Streptomyces sp. AK02-01A]|uniref:MerR family transcriptional regulator n=1 Tax=Streptomyces sp. AK02-01A TaxID=3028648 RepID=UPI0029A6A8A3|nr:MerR family transcriptional regulator [Streptomyces sp. AK02-01A]MDX3855001.1 MerR family transcriptional regulator [Streptomyces sp. AK02-01A]
MRMAELSDRSGITTATIKYYLREGLLRPGRRISATQAEYDEDHLRRLRLVRALIQVGRMPVATAREVLVAVEDESLDHHMRLGAAVWALPQGSTDAADGQDEAARTARRRADALLEELGWTMARQDGDRSPAYRTLVAAIAGLSRTGYPCDQGDLLAYGRLAGELAVTDLDMIERYGTAYEQIEAAVALTVLYEPVLLSLRRLAEAEESNRRFGDGGCDV